VSLCLCVVSLCLCVRVSVRLRACGCVRVELAEFDAQVLHSHDSQKSPKCSQKSPKRSRNNPNCSQMIKKPHMFGKNATYRSMCM